MPSPRTSFEGTANDSGKLVIVNAPQGLEYLPEAQPAPATRKYTKPTITEAPSGNPSFPTRASQDDLAVPAPKNTRGGAGRVSTTEGGRSQGHRGDESA